MLRNPNQIDILSKSQGFSANELVRNTDYMYDYLMKDSYELSRNYDHVNENQANNLIFEWLKNDYQMWHLDNHLHYSPYFDTRILAVMFSLRADDQLDQGLKATIQKKIVELVNPQFLKLLSDKKNTAANWENFTLHYKTIPGLSEKLV